MDSNVQFRAGQATVPWVRPSWGRSTRASVIRALAGLGEPIELSGGSPRSRHSPPESGGYTTVTLSAVRAHRGTEISNPVSSCGESTNFLFPLRRRPLFEATVNDGEVVVAWKAEIIS